MGLFGTILGLAAPLLGDIIGGKSSSNAVNKASKDQIAGQQAAIDEQRREYDTARSDFQPFMQFGKGGLGPLGDLLGLNGNDAASSAIANLKSSPLFTSLFNTGQEAVLQNASATGGLRGGNTQGALYDLGSNTLSQVIQNQIQNLFGTVGVGEGTTQAVTNVGQHTTDQIGSALGNIGSAKAGGVLGQAGVNNNLINQIAALFAPSNLASLGIKI